MAISPAWRIKPFDPTEDPNLPPLSTYSAMNPNHNVISNSLRTLALVLGALLCAPCLADGPVNCNQSFVAEAQSRCSSEPAAEPCTLIYWEIYGQPARCQLVGNTLLWWVGVPAIGTAIDPATGVLALTYTWIPLGVPKAPTDLSVH